MESPPTLDATTTAAPRAARVMVDPIETLIAEHGDVIYRVAKSVVRDPLLAQDVTQETLLRVWKNLESFRGDAPLRHWIVRIAHNTAVSALRRHREELQDPHGEGDVAKQASRTDTAAAVEGSLARDAFERALDQLDPVSRAVVVLREVEGMSYEAIAESLDLPLSTVKTRLFRGRRVLAGALDGWRP